MQTSERMEVATAPRVPEPSSAPLQNRVPTGADLRGLVVQAQAGEVAEGDRVRVSTQFLMAGLVDQALELLRTLRPGPNVTRLMATCERLLEGDRVLIGCGAGARGAWLADPSAKQEEVLLDVWPNARRLLVVFAGNADSGVMAFHPLHFDRHEAHVLWIRDRSRRFTMVSLQRMGASYTENVACIQRVAEALDVDQLFCLGVSSGVYAALRFGLDLNAEGVLALSGPTNIIVENEYPGATLRDFPQVTMLYRTAPHEARDMVLDYPARRRRPTVRIVYGTENKRDSHAARRMADIPGVTLVPLHGVSDHIVTKTLIECGELEGHINGLFAMRPFEDDLLPARAES